MKKITIANTTVLVENKDPNSKKKYFSQVLIKHLITLTKPNITKQNKQLLQPLQLSLRRKLSVHSCSSSLSTCPASICRSPTIFPAHFERFPAETTFLAFSFPGTRTRVPNPDLNCQFLK